MACSQARGVECGTQTLGALALTHRKYSWPSTISNIPYFRIFVFFGFSLTCHLPFQLKCIWFGNYQPKAGLANCKPRLVLWLQCPRVIHGHEPPLVNSKWTMQSLANLEAQPNTTSSNHWAQALQILRWCCFRDSWTPKCIPWPMILHLIWFGLLGFKRRPFADFTVVGVVYLGALPLIGWVTPPYLPLRWSYYELGFWELWLLEILDGFCTLYISGREGHVHRFTHENVIFKNGYFRFDLCVCNVIRFCQLKITLLSICFSQSTVHYFVRRFWGEDGALKVPNSLSCPLSFFSFSSRWRITCCLLVLDFCKFCFLSRECFQRSRGRWDGGVLYCFSPLFCFGRLGCGGCAFLRLLWIWDIYIRIFSDMLYPIAWPIFYLG